MQFLLIRNTLRGTLFAISDSVTKLSAICAVCGDDALFSWRRPSCNSTELKVIGGSELCVASKPQKTSLYIFVVGMRHYADIISTTPLTI